MHASDSCAGRSRRRRLPTWGATVAVAVGCSGLAAAPGSAATLAVSEGCVVNDGGSAGSTMIVAGAGFTPGDVIDVQTPNDSAFGSGTVDAAGNLSVTMNAPTLADQTKPATATFTLSATDTITPLAAPVSTTFFVANLAVAASPAEAKPGKRVTWSFSGFAGGQTIYAHYLHGKKVVTTRVFGRGTGPCGTLKTKAVFYPGKARYDVYTIQVDNARRYSPSSLPRWIGTLHTHIRL